MENTQTKDVVGTVIFKDEKYWLRVEAQDGMEPVLKPFDVASYNTNLRERLFAGLVKDCARKSPMGMVKVRYSNMGCSVDTCN